MAGRGYHRAVARERRLVAVAAALSGLLAVAYVVLISRHHALAGDQLDYDAYGRFARDGHWFWLDKPFGVPHASAWKPPGYPAWVSLLYVVLGPHPVAVGIVQGLVFAPATVVLTHRVAALLGAPAVPAAFLVALYPMAWQFTGLLYPEALAMPLGLALLLAGLSGEPTPRRAVLVGLLAGAALLVRPTSPLVLAGVLVAWLVTSRRRALVPALVAVAVTAAVATPWVLRNHHVTGVYMLSVQDAAIAGTFNPTSAADPVYPYAWRPLVPRDADLLEHPVSEAEIHETFNQRAYDYIADHPESLAKAFFWNGLSRFWDVRRPSRAVHDAPFEGRAKGVAYLALVSYWLLLPFALFGLTRLRREHLAALLTMALLASIAYTIVSGTRYRAPLEPLIAILACSGVAALAGRRGTGAD
jgi:hypothetical protein